MDLTGADRRDSCSGSPCSSQACQVDSDPCRSPPGADRRIFVEHAWLRGDRRIQQGDFTHFEIPADDPDPGRGLTRASSTGPSPTDPRLRRLSPVHDPGRAGGDGGCDRQARRVRRENQRTCPWTRWMPASRKWLSSVARWSSRGVRFQVGAVRRVPRPQGNEIGPSGPRSSYRGHRRGRGRARCGNGTRCGECSPLGIVSTRAGSMRRVQPGERIVRVRRGRTGSPRTAQTSTSRCRPRRQPRHPGVELAVPEQDLPRGELVEARERFRLGRGHRRPARTSSSTTPASASTAGAEAQRTACLPFVMLALIASSAASRTHRRVMQLSCWRRTRLPVGRRAAHRAPVCPMVIAAAGSGQAMRIGSANPFAAFIADRGHLRRLGRGRGGRGLWRGISRRRVRRATTRPTRWSRLTT